MKLPIIIKIKNRPIYSLLLSIKYSFLGKFSNINENNWNKIIKSVGLEDSYKHRMDRFLNN